MDQPSAEPGHEPAPPATGVHLERVEEHGAAVDALAGALGGRADLTDLVGDDVDISRYEDNNGTISAFLSGQVDLIATGNAVAAAILERNPPIRPELKFLVQNSPCYIGLNKGEAELLAAVNEIIETAKTDGSLEAISQTWLGQPLPADL